jgi:hypothetical protein
MTKLEPRLRQELEQCTQAYLGFMQGGMVTTTAGEPALVISRAETIDVFCQLYGTSPHIRQLLRDEYPCSRKVTVRREWWDVVSGGTE